MRIKFLVALFFALLLSSQSVCHAQFFDNAFKKKSKTGVGYYFWPIFFGGGTFFFSEENLDSHPPGYTFSGGVTFSIFERKVNFMEYEGNLFFFADALYSFRAYEGYPQELHYHIEETTMDLAVGVGFNNIYIGALAQLPNYATIKVREWTIEDFKGLSRDPSFSFICGFRIVGDHLGIDIRLLLGQGPGQFLSKAFGDHWLGQLSVGITAGF
ncbi:MAG: hypothetical protein FWB90_01665 [Fibromonadales bacterium]|nr:hypothetical protein [Fibromonadales bacterium]